jgi:hypothetical protein
VSWAGWATPAWLAGLAALAVPVAIHLLSRGRQRRMRIGSVRWLAPAATLRARRLRPSRWRLLALRCALIGVLVLILAGPRLEVASRPGPDWVLVSPDLIAERAALEASSPELYRRLDALREDGTTVRWLAAGLPIGPSPAAAAGDLWSLLREADREAPAEVAFEVFVVDRLGSLRGERPVLGRSVAWHPVVDPRPNRWIERAVETADGGLSLVLGESDSARTRYESRAVPAGTTEGLGWTLVEGAAGRRVEAVGGDVAPGDDQRVVAPRSLLSVWIVHDEERAVDARHVRAAVEAVAESTSMDLDLQQAASQDLATLEGSPRLVFWLAAEPVGGAVLATLAAGATLVSDCLARSEPAAESVPISAAVSALGAGRFDRWGPVDEAPAGSASTVLWGTPRRPWLELAAEAGGGRWLRFHGRFHPAWTDLVTTGALPHWLLGLLADGGSEAPSARAAASDRRAAGTQARLREADAAVVEGRRRIVSAGAWPWLALLLLAAAERGLARWRRA